MLAEVEPQRLLQEAGAAAVIPRVEELHPPDEGSLGKDGRRERERRQGDPSSGREGKEGRPPGPHLVRLFFAVGEVAAQVVLVPVALHRQQHLRVLGVLLEVGVGARDGPLQVAQLGHRTSANGIALLGPTRSLFSPPSTGVTDLRISSV